MNDMKKVIIVLLLSLPMLCAAQFVARSGILVGGGGTTVYGKNIESAPISSEVSTGAFIDWQDDVMGFKTSGVWTTYEGGAFKNGTLSLEFLPKVQWKQTGLWAGVGAFTILNAPSNAPNATGIGMAGEIGWAMGRIMISGRIRNTFSDLSSEIAGKQRSLEFGGRVYYSLIMN
jgi:hypothetical protein